MQATMMQNVSLPKRPVAIQGYRKQMAGRNVAVAPARVAIRSKAATSTVCRATSYTVQSGDWLSTIAPKFGVTAAQIKEANPSLANSDVIVPGMTLSIPAGEGSSGFGTKTWIGAGIILALVLTALLNKPSDK